MKLGIQVLTSICKNVACDHLCGSVAALLAERFVRDDFIIGPVVLLIANAHTESSQLYVFLRDSQLLNRWFAQHRV